MKIADYDKDYFDIIPESPSERGLLDKFPAFLRVKRRFLMAKKPHVIRNILARLKLVYKKPIASYKEFNDMLSSEVELKDLPEDFPWITTPLRHQELALKYLYTHGHLGLLLSPGLGKTYVILNYIKLMGFKRSLVVCPKALCFVWVDEVRRHRPDLDIHVMSSTSWESRIEGAKKRLLKWSGDDERSVSNRRIAERDLERFPKLRDAEYARVEEADIVVINYEKVAPGMDYLSTVDFDMIAVDEGLIKDTSTQRTKAITKLSTAIPSRIVMSGTLINNGPLDVYAPIRFMEPSLVGTGYARFESYYARYSSGRQKFVVGMAPNSVQVIKGILESCSIVMTKDWLDLPGKTFLPKYVDMTEEQNHYYHELRRNYITEIGGGYVEATNPLTVAGKLHQICNGFIYSDSTIPIPTNKGAVLKELIDELSDRKVIIWYNYEAELSIIKEVLGDTPYKVIKGGNKDTGADVHEFNDSPTLKVLVCQAQAVNYGITVLGSDPESLESDIQVLPDFDTRCYTQIFWSLSYSLERFLQQQDRIHRIGQVMECEYYILMTRDSIEEYIWGCLADKKDISDTILEDIMYRITLQDL
jgi:SNF2 family DNA or RNA helicase